MRSTPRSKQIVLPYRSGAPAHPAVPLKKQLLRWTACLFATAIMLLGAWVWLFTFTEYRTDPRSPRYWLWKHGVLPLDPANGFHAFALDTDRDSIVLGLTPGELQKKFGLVRRPGNLLEWQQCYYKDFPPGIDCAWLGDSEFEVEFRNGRVVSLTLMKG